MTLHYVLSYQVISAHGNLTFYYMQDKLNWTLSEFTSWNFYDSFIKMGFSSAVIWRFGRFDGYLGDIFIISIDDEVRLNDFVGICGSFVGIIAYIIISTLQKSWQMYLGN